MVVCHSFMTSEICVYCKESEEDPESGKASREGYEIWPVQVPRFQWISYAAREYACVAHPGSGNHRLESMKKAIPKKLEEIESLAVRNSTELVITSALWSLIAFASLCWYT